MSEHLLPEPVEVTAPAVTSRQRHGTLRDLVATFFRHQQFITRVFIAILVGAVLVGIFFVRYESEAMILVKHQRVDPVVSSDRTSGVPIPRTDLTEQEVNSEVEILKSDDLLRETVIATGLDQKVKLFSPSSWFAAEEEKRAMRIAKAVKRLDSNLAIFPTRRTNLLTIRYTASDPKQAHAVLKTFVDAYIKKHVAVNSMPQQFGFFAEQAEAYQNRLTVAEEELSRFNRTNSVTSPIDERNKLLDKVTSFDAELQTTRAEIAENRDRERVLRSQLRSSPDRLTTEIKTINNQPLLEELKSSLLKLELQHTELLAKFAPTYRPVREIEDKIAQTKQAIAREESHPVRDETTNRDPAYEWVRTEQAKSGSQKEALRAREAMLLRTIKDYNARIADLDQKAIAQQALVRNVKAAESEFLLYQQKREEARINDALDQRQMVNVAVAQPPTQPTLPARSPLMYALIGGVLGLLVASALVFSFEYMDQSFRTPRELETGLGVPVLASIPAPSASLSLEKSA
jgi:polysaccharide biosynthesis transport protein